MTTKRLPSSKRPYLMRRRQAAAEATRGRIVAAIVALHEEVGPRNTTIKAIAERAGVERLTVYRHFPNEEALFRACSSCWSEAHPPPPPDWRDLPDAPLRTRAALAALYRYYRANHRMLTQVHRDLPDFPILAEVSAPFGDYLRTLADELSANWTPSGGGEPAQAVLRHAVRFETWALLEAEGWPDAVKVDRMLSWVASLAN